MIYLFESLGEESRPHPGNRTERKEAGLVGPTKSRLVSNLALSWAEQEPTWAQQELTWAQLGRDSFTPSWAQQRHNMENLASNEASSIAKK